MKMRALIVDDDPLARQRIRRLSDEEPDLEIAGECANGAEAVDQIRRQPPDLLLLDVQMPGIDGFQVLRRLPAELLPVVIITTASDEYAVRAFEVHALDYLLKPVSRERFKAAIERVRKKLARRKET